MTDKEKAIVTAYTGITMLSGEKFSIFHKYVEDIMGRPVFTHELADEFVWEQIKERSRADFIRLCEHSERPIKGLAKMDDNGEVIIELLRPRGEWITDERGYVCSECGALHSDDYPFCHMCGADMRKEASDEQS